MHKPNKDAAGDPSVDHQPSYADALLATPRAWLQFRDTQCRVEGDAARSGSMEPMLEADCTGRLSVGRTTRLA